MRRIVFAAALVAIASPLAAQATQQAKDNDPTKKVAGGIKVAGWQGRLDDNAVKRGMTINDAKFVAMGANSYHVTSGPAAIYYAPKNKVKGEYTARASFTQTKAPTHPEAYGLFIGGRDLQQPSEQYLYFLTRGDGKFLINHRAGPEVHKLVDWTDSEATKKQDEAGKATNELAIRVTKDSVQFLANGTPVKAFAKAEMHGFDTDGQAGIRVNHNLDVHVANFEVKSSKKK
jgi:hypothetical protein